MSQYSAAAAGQEGMISRAEFGTYMQGGMTYAAPGTTYTMSAVTAAAPPGMIMEPVAVAPGTAPAPTEPVQTYAAPVVETTTTVAPPVYVEPAPFYAAPA